MTRESEKRAEQLTRVGEKAAELRAKRIAWMQAGTMQAVLPTMQNIKREAAAHAEMSRARRDYDAACAELARVELK